MAKFATLIAIFALSFGVSVQARPVCQTLFGGAELIGGNEVHRFLEFLRVSNERPSLTNKSILDFYEANSRELTLAGVFRLLQNLRDVKGPMPTTAGPYFVWMPRANAAAQIVEGVVKDRLPSLVQERLAVEKLLEFHPNRLRADEIMKEAESLRGRPAQ